MLNDLTHAAAKLLKYRDGGKLLEARFVVILDEAASRGTARMLAKGMGISEPYLCDIRRRRRPVTDELLERIVGGKA